MENSKSLKILNTICKIGKILSMVVFICCIVGAIGCLIGIVSNAIFGVVNIKVGGVTLHNIIENSAGLSMGDLYASMFVGLFACLGEIFVAAYAKQFFEHCLKVGTPFDMELAKKMTTLGILCIAVPIAVTIASAIGVAIIGVIFGNVKEVDIADAGSIGMGIMFLVMSLVCRVGAEKNDNTPKAE